jgi:RHS repeat-associated protein
MKVLYYQLTENFKRMQPRPTLMMKHLKRNFSWLQRIMKNKVYFSRTNQVAVLFICSALSFAGTAFGQNDDGGVEPPPVIKLFANRTYFPAAIDFSVGVPQSISYSPDPQEIQANRKIKHIITLSVHEEIPQYIPTDFSATVRVEIKYGTSSSSTSTSEQELTVDYKRGSGAKYNAKNYIHFDDVNFVEIKILTLPASVNGFNPITALKLEHEMRVTRYFQLAQNAQIQGLALAPLQPNADELALAWGAPLTVGATHTQLEWVWVEDDMLSTYNDANGNPDYEKMFKNNSTRIDLSSALSGYSIPLIYGGPGRLHYRVRPVNIKNGTREDGNWTTVQWHAFAGHEPSLNWQSTASYAEEGKRKVVVQYFDGSLRSRQTVTKENINNTTVTAETFYDGQGRPAVQILPAPGINNIIQYTKNLNLFNNQVANSDPAKIFDLYPIADPNELKLQAASGASRYYSPSNDKVNDGANKNIPDAEGYPYTLTRYMPDATGRIMAQSGVGPTLKMDDNHETKYYYGNAEQPVLDALFGTEVGYESHYFKNMVKDANGQMSISYVDMHGRTIATALAGGAPPNMISLNVSNSEHYPNQAGTEITRNLLSENTNVVRGNIVESVNTLLVSADDTYQFKYKLTPAALGLTVNSASLCYDCMYNLEISITNENGEGIPIVRKFTNIDLDADDDCGTTIAQFQGDPNNPPTTVSNNEITFSEFLAAGSHIVRKSLTISEASLEKYKQEYLTKALAQTEAQLIAEIESQMLQASTCDDPPTEACTKCNTTLGSFENYRDSYWATAPNTPLSEIQESYDEAKLICDQLCSNTSSQEVATIRDLMIADMLAYTGQYSRELEEGETAGSMYTEYNIDPVTNPAGSDPKLAEQILLPDHPEYDRLIFAESPAMKSNYDWITEFLNTSTYADAANKGYIITSAANLNDPFYTTASEYPQYKSDMATKISQSFNGDLSMWQMAYGSVMCNHLANPIEIKDCYAAAPKVPPFNNLTTEQKDQVWNAFKALYASEHNNQVNNFIAVKHPLPNAETLIDQGYILHFPENAQQVNEQLNRHAEPGSNLSMFPITTGGAPDFTNIPGGTTPSDVYKSNCSGYIELWKQTLLKCPALDAREDKLTIVDNITAAMRLVCEKATNEANPYGASTLAPGTPPDGSPQSFEEIINQAFANLGIEKTALCNPFVIEAPKPYNSNPILTKEYIIAIEKCHCDRFQQLKADALAAQYNPNTLSSLNEYLFATYGETLSQVIYDGMVQNCAKLGTTACREELTSEGCTERVCEEVGNSFMLPGVQTMPEFLKCGYTNVIRCLTCAQLSNYITELKAYFTGSTYTPNPVFTGDDLTDANIADNVLFAQFVNYRTGFMYTWAEYAQKASETGCDLMNYATNGGAMQTVICRNTKPLSEPSDFITEIDPCADVKAMAVAKAQWIMKRRRQALIEDFEKAYRAKCMLTTGIEDFTVKYTPKEYHYTLYYYDMAGNLVKTVPPKGVRPNYDPTYLAAVKAEREKLRLGQTWTAVVPAHVLTTDYRYNSLNQVVQQKTPDAGISKFWYDRVGRLAVSQNAQQAADGKYSYTIYDDLGRITEVGQKPQGAISQIITQNKTDLENWIKTGGGVREQVTYTEYDIRFGTSPQTPDGALVGLLDQLNLRNRVSSVGTKKLDTDQAFYTATHYTYDIHGNVDQLLQDYEGIPEMVAANKHFVKIEYSYDLISGKVNTVSYQPGKEDAFYHRYVYDAENRLIEAETSRDNIVWERDAAYQYYKHGPLARTELGKLRVQGIDYVYTLQGWLKGVNPGASAAGSSAECTPGSAPDHLVESTRNTSITQYIARQSITFEPDFETQDGDAFEAFIDPNLIACDPGNNPDVPTATTWDEMAPATRDAYNFSLHYFNNDYKPIAGAAAPGFIPVLGAPNTNAQPLYNGNIAAMAVSISKLSPLSGGAGGGNLYNYRYDQLNRLVSMDAYTGLTSTGFTQLTHTNDYQEGITYDPNGNILSYLRNGTTVGGKPLAMDNLAYNYKPNTNQLRHVDDDVNPANYTEDIDDQEADYYDYDAIGNLIKEGIGAEASNITWTVYGKIATISKSGTNIVYTYDARGNRITKTVNGKLTIYVREPSGNVMSIYEKPAATALKQIETHIYGGNRVGIVNELTVATANVSMENITAKLSTFTRGEKVFELSNHLGNVLATINDKKIGHEGTNGLIDYYLADIISASDYAPFGMQMVGRNWNSRDYRYGFNGKENDNEVKGEGNLQDYGMRIYDTRLGKFLSIDPLTNEYAYLTPYQFGHNNPIALIDLDGLEGAEPPKPGQPGKNNGDKEETKGGTACASDNGGCDPDDPSTFKRKTWYWYSGNLDRNATADWYSKEEYEYITQDWENGQVLLPHEGYTWLDWSTADRSEIMKNSKGEVIRNWQGLAVNEKGYLMFHPNGSLASFPAIYEMGAVDGLLKGLGKISKLRQIAPSLFKEGAYSVYRGFKNGVLYVGKTAYTIEQRYAGKISPEQLRAFERLNGTIPNNGIAKGIEQLIMNLNGWKGRAQTTTLSNKNAATINEIYLKVAERWLNKNVKDWQTLYKIIK